MLFASIDKSTRFAALLALILAGCGTDDACSEVRDLSKSPAGLALTEEEHPVGWAHTECFQCHQAWNIHANDCLVGVALTGSDIPVDSTDGCRDCHGWNGVPEWVQDTDDTDVTP
jgi:hypothetical protein